MSVFSQARAAHVDAVFAVHGEDGIPFTPKSGSGPATVRTILRRPAEQDEFQGGLKAARPRPRVRIPYADAPSLAAGDQFDQDGRRWRIAASPIRPGDGAIWEVDIEDAGATP